MNSYEHEHAVAVDAVMRAVRLCVAVRQAASPESLTKKDASPVTVADYGSQALICQTLEMAFADDPVIAEEDSASLREPANRGLLDMVAAHVGREQPACSADDVCRWIDRGGGQRSSDRFWTLDPIDGTKGFIRNEQYAVALALIVHGRPVVAALGCPNLDGAKVYSAVAGQGAGPAGGGRLSVSDTREPQRARFCESVESGHSSHDGAAQVARLLGITARPVRMDSQCKYAVVARGDAEIYLRLPTRPGYVERIWDHAAGALLVTEAGGRVTDIAGGELEFTHGRGLEANRGIVATNGHVHDAVLAAIASCGAGRPTGE